MGRTALFSRNTPGGVFTIDDFEEHPGEIWFVNSATGTNSLGHGKSPDSALASVAYAFSSDLVASGDVVYVMPGHTETIAAAGGITSDIAGVKVVGLGWGATRPTFSFSATDSTWLITAASVVVKNIIVKSTVVELVNMFTVSAASVTLDAVDHINGGANTTIQFLLTTAAADYLAVRNCKHYMATTPAAVSVWVNLVGSDFSVVKDNVFVLTMKNDSGVRTLATTTTACLGLLVDGNIIYQSGGTTQDLVVSMVSGTTGIYSDNRTFGDVGTLAASIALASMAGSNSFHTTTVNKSGILDPVVA